MSPYRGRTCRKQRSEDVFNSPRTNELRERFTKAAENEIPFAP